MRFFTNMPIKRKLTTIILVSCAAVLLLSGAATIATEWVLARRQMVQNMTVQADLLGRYSTAPLSFHRDEDADEVTRTLSAIEADPHIVLACVYDRKNNRFGEYARAGAARDFPDKTPPDGHRFTGDYLELSHPVQLDQRRIGTIYLRADLGSIYSQLEMHAAIMGLVLLVAVIFTFVLSPALRRPIAEPILALAGVARDVAERKDYSTRATKRSHDEVGLLTEAFNQMLSEIETTQTSLQKANQSMTEQAREIVQSIDVLVSASSQILSTSSQLTTGAVHTATAVSQTTTTIGEVRQTVRRANERAASVSDNALKMSQISRNGAQSAEEVVAGINQIRQQMQSVGDTMVRLTEQSETIGQIVSTVDDLASQSNILAVNAAIEAARAGEHGRGFGVVAQEVKNLAEQSQRATDEVRKILHDIRLATSAAVMATERGSKSVEAGVRQSSEAGESIQLLATSIATAAQVAAQITSSSQDQLLGMDQVAAAMESIGQTSAQNVNSAKQLEAAAHNLKELGQKLQKTVATYKIK
jgi:methyl-accepting chemotaxis protein